LSLLEALELSMYDEALCALPAKFSASDSRSLAQSIIQTEEESNEYKKWQSNRILASLV
jgi:hypothetical protein